MSRHGLRISAISLRLLYPRGNSTQYPLVRRLGGSQSRSERYEEEKKPEPAENRIPALQLVAPRIILQIKDIQKQNLYMKLGENVSISLFVRNREETATARFL
jgi:hypothetical protein